MDRTRASQLLRRFARHRFLIFITLLALAVRLTWNLCIHPPWDFVFSDMGSYVRRANRLLDSPLSRHADEVFWPYGTHALLAAVKAVFGRGNHVATAVYQALLGALVAPLAYATSRRLTRRRWAPRLVGLIAALYYPLIALGGYYLSETPFSACVTASAYLTLRLSDEGRPRHAWLLGLVLGIGAVIRTQILMSIPFLTAFWLLRRRAFPRLRPGLLPRAAAPLCVVLGLSTAYAYHHTGRLSLVAQNGAVNRVFARCHNTSLRGAHETWFRPPSLNGLHSYGAKHPDALFKLDPAIAPTLTFGGRMWEENKLHPIADDCIRRTGWLRQARYGITHVVLLWGYNNVWPDSSREPWKHIMRVANGAHAVALLPPLAVALFLGLRRRWARTGVLAMHIWALLAVAVLYFGETRYRVPYDAVIIVLALHVAAYPGRWILHRLGALLR